MKKIIILGATGLIGHQVYFQLKANKDFSVLSFAHQKKISQATILLDARDEHLLEKVIVGINPDVIVNCMGVLIAEANRNHKTRTKWSYRSEFSSRPSHIQ